MNSTTAKSLIIAVCLTCSQTSTLAQVVAARNFSWSPYRTVPSAATPASVQRAQYENCEPCPPGYSEVITDMDLQQMRRPGAYYPELQMAQPAVVGQPGYFTAAPASSAWQWELLPSDVIWHSYWAGVKEPRTSAVLFQELHGNTATLDVALGGRASVARYGTRVNGQPEGFEVQLEGAGLPRLNLDSDWDLESADFRFGVPLIYGEGRAQWKLAYYHLSSHLGDEYIRRMGFDPNNRVNYARDTILFGFSFYPFPAWRWYAETGWAFYANEGADPWEFQFGVDYAQPGPTGLRGTPFAAVNGHLRQEVDYGGLLSAQAGWLWRGKSGRVIRTGLHYVNGKSSQFEFNGPLEKFEQQLGAGLWYDY